MFVCFLRKIWSQKKGEIWLLYLVKMVLMWVKMKMVETELMVVRLMFLTRLVSLLECTLQSLPSLHSSWQKKDSVTRQNSKDKENSEKNKKSLKIELNFLKKLVKWKQLIDKLIRFHKFFSTNFPNLKVKGLAAKMDKMFMSGQVHKYKNLEKIYIYALYSPRSSSQKWCCSPVLIFLSESPLNVTSNRFLHLTEFLKLNCFASFEKLLFRIFTRILVNFQKIHFHVKL